MSQDPLRRWAELRAGAAGGAADPEVADRAAFALALLLALGMALHFWT